MKSDIARTDPVSVVSETENMTAEQIRAIFDKYLEEYPEDRHFPCLYLFCEATTELLFE